MAADSKTSFLDEWLIKENPSLDPFSVRKDFPILETTVRGKPLTFLDSAASSQKPRVVIEAIKAFYESSYANIHRGVYQLSSKASFAYEQTRAKVQNFIKARDQREIVFVRGTTEAINLIATVFGETFFKQDDEIIISALEHHSNIVPWQFQKKQRGINIKVLPMNERGELIIEELEKQISNKTKLIAVNHVSNALGTINPVKEICRIAHSHGIPVLVDGAQGIPHLPVDVQDIDCDFYCFSAHKAYGPTGSGVLYGKYSLLKQLPPYQGGGDMIRSVTFEKTLYDDPPHRFEAGTPDIAGVVGMGVAIHYLDKIGMTNIHDYGTKLLNYATAAVSSIDGLRIIGNAREKVSVVSFVIDGIHPHDVGTILDSDGIAVRTGHHCAQPVMDFFGIPATTRVSLALYNTFEDIDRLVASLKRVVEVFK